MKLRSLSTCLLAMLCILLLTSCGPAQFGTAPSAAPETVEGMVPAEELDALCAQAATYLLAITGGTLLCSLAGAWYVGADWSPVATLYPFLYGDGTAQTIQSLLPMNLYQQMSVTEAVCRSYLLLFLYLTLSSAVLLFAGLLRWKFLVLLHSDSMWLFPCAHALTWSHYTEYFEAPVAPFWCSVAYWGIGIVLFSLGALLMIGGRDFDSTLEFDSGSADSIGKS